MFALHPLSRAMINETFPQSQPAATNSFIDAQSWSDFSKTQGGLSELVEELLPSLTGLALEQITDLGYAVIDADNDQTWVYVLPAAAMQSQV
jgi:hypothetical protein